MYYKQVDKYAYNIHFRICRIQAKKPVNEAANPATNLATNLYTNVAANVDAATNPYECLRMLAALQIWLRMWANVANSANVVIFANIRDKKASADAYGCLAAVLSFCVPPDMKKAGNFPAFILYIVVGCYFE